MASSSNFERLISPDAQASDRRRELRAQIAMGLSILTIVLVCGLWLWGYIATNQQPKIKDVTITSISTIGPTDLCPGDALRYTYDYTASGEGVLNIDATIWRMTPPQTVIFSLSRVVVLIGDVAVTRAEMWVVPATYQDPATLTDVPLPAGQYMRDIAITSPSRSIVSSVAQVPFTIKDNCK